MKKGLFNILLVFKKYNISNDIFFTFIKEYFTDLLIPIIKRNDIELLTDMNHIIRNYKNKTYILKSVTNNGKQWKPVKCYSDKNNNIIFEYGIQNIVLIDDKKKYKLLDIFYNKHIIVDNKVIFTNLKNVYSNEYILFNTKNEEPVYTYYTYFFRNLIKKKVKIYYILQNELIELYIVILNHNIICLIVYYINNDDIKIIPYKSMYYNENYKYIYSDLLEINIKQI